MDLRPWIGYDAAHLKLLFVMNLYAGIILYFPLYSIGFIKMNWEMNWVFLSKKTDELGFLPFSAIYMNS